MYFSTDHSKLLQNLRKPTEYSQWVFAFWYRVFRVSEILIMYSRFYESGMVVI